MVTTELFTECFDYWQDKVNHDTHNSRYWNEGVNKILEVLLPMNLCFSSDLIYGMLRANPEIRLVERGIEDVECGIEDVECENEFEFCIYYVFQITGSDNYYMVYADCDLLTGSCGFPDQTILRVHRDEEEVWVPYE